MIKIAVSGCRGRMGKRIEKLIQDEPGVKLAGSFDIDDDANRAIGSCDVLIEFTTPDATIKNLKIAKDLGKAVIIGTTGLDKERLSFINEAAKKIPIVFSPNMAVGVNILFELAKEAASVLGKAFSISISETHHIHKKDAPSGTAKRLQAIVSEEAGKDPGSVKVESQRIGEVVGDHKIVFDGKEERLEIIHHAKSRDVFARGAVIAAKFIAKKGPGLYSMNEVLGI